MVLEKEKEPTVVEVGVRILRKKAKGEIGGDSMDDPLEKLSKNLKNMNTELGKIDFGDVDNDGVPNPEDCSPFNPEKQENFRKVQDEYLKGTPLLRVRGRNQAHYAWSVLFSPQYLSSVSWERASMEYDRLSQALPELGISVSKSKSDLRELWESVH